MSKEQVEELERVTAKIDEESLQLEKELALRPSDPLQKILRAVHGSVTNVIDPILVAGHDPNALAEYSDEISGRIMLVEGIISAADKTILPSIDRAANKQIVKNFDTSRMNGRHAVKQAKERIVAPLARIILAIRESNSGAGNGESVVRTPRGRFVVRDVTEFADQSTTREFEGGRLIQAEGGPADVQLVPVDVSRVELEERQREMMQIAEAMRDVREVQTLYAANLAAQGELLEGAEHDADLAHDNAARGRLQLSTAAKYKLLGATMVGALVGGLVGGPVGAIAGASSASTILGAAGVGAVGGAVVTRVVARNVVNSVARVDEDYDDRRIAESHK